MEILATNTHWGAFIATVSVLSLTALLSVLITFGGLFTIISGESRKVIDFVLTTIVLGCSIGILIATFSVFKEGPQETYNAKIKDFNEVYNEGYEIVDSNGSLYILRKAER